MVDIPAGYGSPVAATAPGDLRRLFPHFSVAFAAAGRRRHRCRLWHGPLVDVGCAARRTPAFAGCQRGSTGCGEAKFKLCRQCQFPRQQRGRHSTAVAVARFRLLARRAASRPGHAGRNRGHRRQAEAGRAIPGLSLLRPGQSPGVVSRAVAHDRFGPPSHFAAAVSASADGQPNDRGAGLLAAGARRPLAVPVRIVGAVSAVSLLRR